MKKCPSCGGVRILAADGDLCPACLLQLGLDAARNEPGHSHVAGRFRLVAPIGRGPRATVYLAQAGHAQRGFVTVKLFHERLDVDRFVAHVRELAARIGSSPRVASLTIPEAGPIDESHAFVVARYVPGMPASAYIPWRGGRACGSAIGHREFVPSRVRHASIGYRSWRNQRFCERHRDGEP